jgi:hypothetical protein
MTDHQHALLISMPLCYSEIVEAAAAPKYRYSDAGSLAFLAVKIDSIAVALQQFNYRTT